MYEPEEILYLVIASVVIGFLLSLGFPGFILHTSALLLTILLVFIMFFIFTGVQKLVAYSLDCNSKVKLMTFNQYGFSHEERLGFQFPMWLVLPLVLALITSGKFIWTAILNFEPDVLKTRVQRKFSQLTDTDVAKIAISGPLALMIFGLIMRIAGFNSYAYLCVLTAFLSFLPLGNGIKIFAGMRTTAVFLLALSLAVLILMHLINPIATIIIALIIAIAWIITYYVLWEQ